ncbi:MAG: hypothetical protein WBD25_20775 [Terriglobales bacterium]|jgi:hypothetical protein
MEIVAPKREITIDSNWIMTIGMALLVVFCGWQLIREAHRLVFDSLAGPVLLTHLIDKISTALVMVCYFLAAFSLWPRPVRIAGPLLGTDLLVRVALHYFHAATTAQHSAAVAGSIARQIALVLVIVAIAQWFKSVVRRTVRSEHGVSDS